MVVIHFQQKGSVLLFPRLLRSWLSIKCICLTPPITDAPSCLALYKLFSFQYILSLYVHFKIDAIFSVQFLNQARIQTDFICREKETDERQRHRERQNEICSQLSSKIHSHFYENAYCSPKLLGTDFSLSPCYSCGCGFQHHQCQVFFKIIMGTGSVFSLKRI